MLLYGYNKQSQRKIQDFYFDIFQFARSFPYLRPWAFYISLLGTTEDWLEHQNGTFDEIAYLKRAVFKHFRIWIAVRYISIWILSPLIPVWGTAIWFFSKAPSKTIVIPPGSVQTGAEIPKEKWFFINGIGVDYELAKWNATHLADLFQRSVELIYKPTHGMFYDLAATVGGRTFNIENSTDMLVQSSLQEALLNENNKKVVVIAHSQGSVILCNAVRKMIEKGDETYRKNIERKLEIYNFANLSSVFAVVEQGPMYENFVNPKDIVVQTSMTAVPKVEVVSTTERTRNKGARIQTYFHKNPEKQGHLLGAYIQDFVDGLYLSNDETYPKLLKYIPKKKEGK